MKGGHVRSWTADYLKGSKSCSVSGTVAGSSGQNYSVWVSLNLEKQSVLDYDCTCPAQLNYAGMCKHSIALALEYLASPEAKTRGIAGEPENDAQKAAGKAAGSAAAELDNLTDQRNARESAKASKASKTTSKSSAAKKRQEPQPTPTSRALTSLMDVTAAMAQHQTELAIARFDEAHDDTGEPAELLCTIARVEDPYGYRYYGGADDQYELRLRVKKGKASYVVKRIDQLIADWRGGAFREYGKNLAFTHNRRAFDDRANQLLELIEGMERAQRAFYYSSTRYWYSGQGTATKSLALSSRDTIAVLDTLIGSQATLEIPSRFGSKKASKTLSVVKGNPNLAFSLEKSDMDGWDLHVPKDAECIRCEDDLYVASGERLYRCDADFARKAGTMLEGLLPGGASPLHIASTDVPVFCERILPALEQIGSFHTPDELAELAPPEPTFAFRIGSMDGCITCNATVSYDEATLGLFDDLRAGQPVRDIPSELKAQAAVREFFPNGYVSSPNYGGGAVSQADLYSGNYGKNRATARFASGYGAGPGLPWFPSDEVEKLYELYAIGFDALSELGEVYVSESLRGVSVRQAPEIKIEASVSAGLLDLAVDASGMTPEDLMNYLASYRRKQRFVRLSNGDIVRIGENARAIGELADGLGISDADLLGADGAGGQVPANRTLFVDALMKSAGGVRFDRNEAFRSIVRSFDTVADSDFTEPGCLRDVLRGYQRTGFKWLSMLAALGFGGILADDMGLGKTVQVIALLQARKEAKEADAPAAGGLGATSALVAPPADAASLVVCPASLVYNWLAEIERFAPELDAIAVVGSAAARKALIADAGAHDVLVTSYDLMKRDIETYASGKFDVVVLDEAHYIKNHVTKSAKSAKRLPAQVRFALTGTPIENRLSELWSIFDFLMPGILGSNESFSRRFTKPIEGGQEGAAERLRKLVSPFILRRLKGDVLTDLPDKNESIVYAVMEGEQDKLYKANADRLALTLSKQLPEEFAHNKIAILAELTRLRQLCCDPHLVYDNYTQESAKLETCMELVAQAVEGGHKILLFSQFTTMLDIIAERLGKERLGYLMLTGATSKEERVRLVREFQEGGAPVFLISLKAGGVGLNLTAADIVIHFDPWWNLAAQNQATDRAHRIGQTRDVSVFKLIAKNTIEEKIVKMQEAKRDLAESVIGGEGVSSAALTRDDVLALLDTGV